MVRFLQPLTEKLDIYSMGMVFYSMLAGHPPFEGEKGALKNIMEGTPPKVDRSWNSDFMDVSDTVHVVSTAFIYGPNISYLFRTDVCHGP